MKHLTAIAIFLLFFKASFAAAAGWLIFGIEGDARLLHDKKTTDLSIKKHLLMEIAPGDSISTTSNGRVILVSLATSDAFEIGANAVVTLGDRELKATKGSFELRKGYTLPKKKPQVMAGVVMRGNRQQECLQAIKGANTATHTLTPTLTWQNLCDDHPVHVSLFSDSGQILAVDTRDDKLIVPQGKLRYGQRYVWLLETQDRDQVAAATFHVLSENETAEVTCLLDKNCSRHTDFSTQLSAIFYLKQKHLDDLAAERLTILAGDYPEIDFNEMLNR